MSYRELYDLVQKIEGLPISRSWLLPEIRQLTKTTPQLRWSSLDGKAKRGVFIKPNDPDSEYVKNYGTEPVILISRGMNECWQRFVMIKEHMHLFDTVLENTGRQEFPGLVSEFFAPYVERSTGMSAEVKCFWRALGVFCPESHRQELEREWQQDRMTSLEVAKIIMIPEQYIPHLFSPDYKEIISALLQEH